MTFAPPHAASLNFTLLRDDIFAWSANDDYNIVENVISMYTLHTAKQVRKIIDELEEKHPENVEMNENIPDERIIHYKISDQVCFPVCEMLILGFHHKIIFSTMIFICSVSVL